MKAPQSRALVMNLTAVCGRHLTATIVVGWVFWSSGKNRQSFVRNFRKPHVAFRPFRRRKINAKELSAHRAMWWQTWAPHWTLNIWMSCCWSVHSTNIELAENERFAVSWPEHSNIFNILLTIIVCCLWSSLIRLCKILYIIIIRVLHVHVQAKSMQVYDNVSTQKRTILGRSTDGGGSGLK